MHWTEEFFDEYYLKSINAVTGPEQTCKEVDFILNNMKPVKDAKILDLACGHGRHVIELARRGYNNVTGLDLTEAYIEMARMQAQEMDVSPTFIKANMLEFQAEGEYDFIYNLFSSLFYFNDKHNLEILKRIYNALKRDGIFLIDYFNPISLLKSDKKKDWYITDDDYLILEKLSHNPISGMLTNERLIITPQGKRIKRMFHVRDYTPAELRYHFENIGFEIDQVYGSFEGENYSIDSPRQIFVLRKPE